MQRFVRRRTIAGVIDTDDPAHTIDLSLVALAAAAETLQIDLVARGWVGLFSALLLPTGSGSPLIWLEGGPGGEAEIKRAYSALFGRFFGRAVLEHEHGCVDLRQVRDGMVVAAGVVVERIPPNTKGDLPDWVSWNPKHGCFSICEAKGCHDRGNWATRRPAILSHAMDQIDRVRVMDASGRKRTKNWVVASRWGTEQNGKEPTIITLDPFSRGEPFSPQDADRVGREAHAFYLADLLRGLGREDLAKALSAPSADADADADELLDRNLTSLAGRRTFAAALIDGSAPIPLTGPRPRQTFEILRGFAKQSGRKIAVVGIERDAVDRALRRLQRDAHPSQVVDDGRTVISGGLVLSWEVDQLEAGDAT